VEIIADYKRSEGIDEIALGALQQRMEVRTFIYIYICMCIYMDTYVCAAAARGDVRAIA